ncbi:hypothetical protein MC885_015522 [Smutsia gigantea]|nr:hypothetical protein MC885_015522 [Smutsia gigantea]
MRPEEAESALEATCYFTEESPSGEPCGLVPLRPCCGAHIGGLQPWVHWEHAAALGSLRPGQGRLPPSRLVPRVFSLLFFLSLPSWTLASPSLCALLFLHFPFQHLLWPQIWTFSCPGRLKKHYSRKSERELDLRTAERKEEVQAGHPLLGLVGTPGSGCPPCLPTHSRIWQTA